MSKTMRVYVMTTANNTVLYTGVANDLLRRVHEDKEGLVEGFTKRYSLSKLVFYEVVGEPEAAIRREKQIKAGSRARKEALIQRANPRWIDLHDLLLNGDAHS